MKYVCDVCGWEYDEEKGYPEGGIAPGAKLGKIFRMILNAPYVQLAKISFLRLSKEVQQDL